MFGGLERVSQAELHAAPGGAVTDGLRGIVPAESRADVRKGRNVARIELRRVGGVKDFPTERQLVLFVEFPGLSQGHVDGREPITPESIPTSEG